MRRGGAMHAPSSWYARPQPRVDAARPRWIRLFFRFGTTPCTTLQRPGNNPHGSIPSLHHGSDGPMDLRLCDPSRACPECVGHPGRTQSPRARSQWRQSPPKEIRRATQATLWPGRQLSLPGETRNAHARGRHVPAGVACRLPGPLCERPATALRRAHARHPGPAPAPVVDAAEPGQPGLGGCRARSGLAHR